MDRISEISLYRCPVRLKVPFVISLGRLDFADNIIVTIRTSQGLTGFGECSPFLTIHGESGETCMAIGKLIAGRIAGMDPEKIGDIHRIMNAVVYGNTSVKSAIDIALHDIAATRRGMPLYAFLGGTNRQLLTDYTVSIGDAEKMAADARKIMDEGFAFIKVKLGGTPAEDLKRMTAIREAVGNQIPVRIDANQAWDAEDAIEILKKLRDYNIEHCEEPISRQRFLSLPRITQASAIPLMADESCFDEEDALRLAEIGACQLFNIKLGKSSGFYRALKIIAIAEKHGIFLQAGGFLESRLGFTATAHLALSHSNFRFFDFDTPLMLSEDFVEGGIRYESGGRVNVPEASGLGACVSAEKLKELNRLTVTV